MRKVYLTAVTPEGKVITERIAKYKNNTDLRQRCERIGLDSVCYYEKSYVFVTEKEPSVSELNEFMENTHFELYQDSVPYSIIDKR